jgi:hypothetical protein
MLNRKACKKCKNKISDSYEFCPHCGTKIGSEGEWGLLGKNDFMSEQPLPMDAILNQGILGKMLGNAMKMLEEEMRKEDSFEGSNFELIINGKRINPKNIKVTKKPTTTQKKVKLQQPILGEFFEKNVGNLPNLPKENPAADVRRFSDKIIYEIKLPGVSSIKDVSIIPLEKSIEVKALGKDKIYSKLIPVSFPISAYNFDSEKLILELDTKEN